MHLSPELVVLVLQLGDASLQVRGGGVGLVQLDPAAAELRGHVSDLIP
jgi:hypothetical protein